MESRMTTFSPEQVQALRELRGIWPNEEMVLIGASALGCYLDMEWRQTYDLDLSMSLSLEDCLSGLEGLEGWTHDSSREHEWHSPQGDPSRVSWKKENGVTSC